MGEPMRARTPLARALVNACIASAGRTCPRSGQAGLLLTGQECPVKKFRRAQRNRLAPSWEVILLRCFLLAT